MFSAKRSVHFNLVSAILFNLMLFSGCQQLLMGDPICLQLLLQSILSFLCFFPWLINTKVRVLCILRCISLHLHIHICLQMCKKIGNVSEGFILKYWQWLPWGLGLEDGDGKRGTLFYSTYCYIV